MKKLLSVVLLSACIVGSAAAGGHHEDKQRRHGGDGMFPIHKLSRVLELSDEQIEQFKLLKEESKEARLQKNRDDSPMKKLADLDPNAANYVENLSLLADSSAAQARERFLDMAEKHAKIQAILSPEQIAKLKIFREKRKGRGERDS